MLKLKICGNHQQQDIDYLKVYQEKIDFIGFIFTKQSKRYVSPQQVTEWMSRYSFLQKKAVGVFLNQEREEIEHVVKLTGIRTVQLHGQETSLTCQEVKKSCGVKLWKVIPVVQGKVPTVEEYIKVADTLLLDTQVKGQSGGTGQTFDWKMIPTLKRQTEQMNIPLWIAGGLNSDNVKELIRTYRVDGIDVASGVETDLAKDKDKIKAFVQGVERFG
jgi:phosphoribosylanthranilate isomerase